ncbi:hypothetical protein ELH49_20710 [Rhizobium ruizarguesonis]|uniref:hypothetical protein n=1 Tax=Rhizobium TaxID=379 RepID=UPI0010316295|nr:MULTISPECIES: hypothetical protein [Rhizobium]MBY5488677.1 hypothetical protein [Rhizobium leguminosarum]TBB46300.1 hypothetical protein ELH49_20710 [Rhizobium ruizarguesonis]TBC42736.1 hypothetical protein ELH31_02685 [Rhizobium ruizarguesonis]
MSVAALRLTHQPLTSSGFLRVQNAVGSRIKDADTKHAVAVTEPQERYWIMAGSHAYTQTLLLGQHSWASSNLEMTIASAGAPTSEEMTAAKAAVERLSARENEDANEWAVKLGTKFGSIVD